MSIKAVSSFIANFWRLGEIALLMASAVYPEFVSPSQALLICVFIEIARGAKLDFKYLLILLSLTTALRAVRDDAVWYFPISIVVIGAFFAPLLNKSKILRMLMVYVVLAGPLFSIINATGLAKEIAVPNLLSLVGVSQQVTNLPVMLDERVCDEFANSWLPLPNQFSPFALELEGDLYNQAQYFIFLVFALAILGLFFNARFFVMAVVLSAVGGINNFLPPSKYEVWIPAASDGWMVLHLVNGEGGVLRSPGADEALPSGELAFFSRHPLRAPRQSPINEWSGALDSWANARMPVDVDGQYMYNRYLG
ncbi:MAG: hypothetical protein QGF46_08320, partial [Planctomycetota bacterium]|nr:hypothetical protein [Planctomycetota bacterium]